MVFVVIGVGPDHSSKRCCAAMNQQQRTRSNIFKTMGLKLLIAYLLRLFNVQLKPFSFLKFVKSSQKISRISHSVSAAHAAMNLQKLTTNQRPPSLCKVNAAPDWLNSINKSENLENLTINQHSPCWYEVCAASDWLLSSLLLVLFSQSGVAFTLQSEGGL